MCYLIIFVILDFDHHLQKSWHPVITVTPPTPRKQLLLHLPLTQGFFPLFRKDLRGQCLLASVWVGRWVCVCVCMSLHWTSAGSVCTCIGVCSTVGGFFFFFEMHTHACAVGQIGQCGLFHPCERLLNEGDSSPSPVLAIPPPFSPPFSIPHSFLLLNWHYVLPSLSL